MNRIRIRYPIHPTRLLVTALMVIFLCSCTDRYPMDPTYANPLPECASRWNCHRTSVSLPLGAHEAAQLVSDVIRDMGGTLRTADGLAGEAVFRIPVFGYRDDVRFVTEPRADGGSVLHLRSQSRKGRFDIGVNRHRLTRLVRLLSQEIRKGGMG